MRGLLLALGLLLPAMAAGQVSAQVNDYPALFAAHAEAVAQPTPTRRVLELPGPVIVTEERGADLRLRYRAEDLSGRGAVLCKAEALTTLLALSLACPTLFDAGEAARLQQMLARTARFIARNSHPAMGEPKAVAYLQDRIRDKASRIGAGCTFDHTTQMFATAALRQGAVAALDRALAKDRLPVMQPCN